MARIFRRVFGRASSEHYDFSKLIDCVEREPAGDRTGPGAHIICDIDKTYLETEFESLFHMARVAFEAATAKITVRGASDVLLAARWGDQLSPDPDAEEIPRGLHFVSSSPPQLRPVLEQKLSLDGLDWSSDTFKNQAYNVLKGRMDLLRQHVGYKSAAILQVIQAQGDRQNFYLIGDNAESDAFIYIGINLRLSGRLNTEQYADYLHCAGIETTVANEISTNFSHLPQSQISGIFIRNAPGYRFVDSPNLTCGVKQFDHFFQVGLLLVQRGLIPATLLRRMVRAFHNQYGYTRQDLASELIALAHHCSDDALSKAITACVGGLGPGVTEPAGMDYAPSTLSNDLSPDQIIDHAKEWVARMHAQKY